jgi:uncharacterized membrane protein
LLAILATISIGVAFLVIATNTTPVEPNPRSDGDVRAAYSGPWVVVSYSPYIYNYGVAVVGARENIYIANSDTNGTANNNIFMRYNTITDNWTILSRGIGGSYPQWFKNGTCMAWDNGNYIYVLFGGSYSDTGGKARHYFYRYNISNNTWENLENTPGSLGQGAGDAITWVPGGAIGDNENYIFAIIGQKDAGTNFLRYTISSNTWVSRASPPGRTDDGCSLVWTGGTYLYALRGEYNETSPCYDFWRYDIVNNTWENRAPIPAYPHDNGSGGVGDGGSLLWIGGSHSDYIYALSGNQCYPEPIWDNRFYRYTISTNSWERLGDLPKGVGDQNGPRLGFSGDKIYCWRGTYNDNQDRVLWAYTVVIRGVEVFISPSYQSGLPSETLNYTVTVANTGNLPENYTLTIENTQPWAHVLDNYTFTNVNPSENRTTTLRVTISPDAIGCTGDNVTIIATSQGDNTVKGNAGCVAHVTVVRGVRVVITPPSQENENGGTLGYDVLVMNLGNAPENFLLTKGDNAGWTLSLDNYWLLVPKGENRATKLNVTIPTDATGCTWDNIWVKATSNDNLAVFDNESCLAHVSVAQGVDISISPSYQSGSPRSVLSYTITITNTGNVLNSYTLTVDDNENWGPTLDENLFRNVAPGENRQTTLRVTVPDNAVPGTDDNIVVAAAGTGVTDSDSCIAHVGIARDVRVSISPEEGEGVPGEYMIEFSVRIMNTGNVTDTYMLENSDDAGWKMWLGNKWESPDPYNEVAIPAGESMTIYLYVTIPPEAALGTEDNITVIATSQNDNEVSGSGTCVARAVAPAPSVEVTVTENDRVFSPAHGRWWVVFKVTLRNTGNVSDRFLITKADELGWIGFENLASIYLMPGSQAVVKFDVLLPEDVEPGTEDIITVTATSIENAEVTDNDSCMLIV